MTPIKLEEATRTLGKPDSWDENNPTIECDALSIIDTELTPGQNIMTSAWKPTTQEIEALRCGEMLILRVWGAFHPPVMLEVANSGLYEPTIITDDLAV